MTFEELKETKEYQEILVEAEKYCGFTLGKEDSEEYRNGITCMDDLLQLIFENDYLCDGDVEYFNDSALRWVERYYGSYDDLEDFAKYWVKEVQLIDLLHDERLEDFFEKFIEPNIDWNGVLDDIERICDYTFIDNHVFSN